MNAKKVLIGLGVVVIAGSGIAANLWWREPAAPEVQAEVVELMDLTATVSGSGAIQPAREVDISSNVMGRVTRMSVEEGDEVQEGQFLLEVDPQRLRSQVEMMEASLQSARTQVQLAQEDLEFAQGVFDRREGEHQQGLIPREQYERALQDVQRAQRALETRRLEVDRLQAQLAQATYDLTQVVIDSPIHGIITRLNIEQGENVVTGTMNNPGTVLMTIADLSVIEAEIEVDETDVVSVEVGQEATVHIDAFPEEEYRAVVTEVGKSPISGTGAATGQAINFKVVVRLLDTVPGARPGLSCTADIVTATREQVPAVPIQALILREVKLDENGEVVRQWELWGDEGPPLDAMIESEEDGDTVEREGAFFLRDGRAVFVPIEVGIAGERHFEVLGGVETGERVIVGPFDVVRTLIDGDRVEAQDREGDTDVPAGT